MDCCFSYCCQYGYFNHSMPWETIISNGVVCTSNDCDFEMNLPVLNTKPLPLMQDVQNDLKALAEKHRQQIPAMDEVQLFKKGIFDELYEKYLGFSFVFWLEAKEEYVTAKKANVGQ